MKLYKQTILLFALSFASASSNALQVNFNNADDNKTTFDLISQGVTYTFFNPDSTDTRFSILNNELLFGTRNGVNNGTGPTTSGGAVDMKLFKLSVDINTVLSGYLVGNNGTQNGGSFSIADTGGMIVTGLPGGPPFNTIRDIADIQLLAGETYTFTYNSANGANSITGLAGFDVAPVPVPAAVWLLGSALAGLICTRRKTAA